MKPGGWSFRSTRLALVVVAAASLVTPTSFARGRSAGKRRTASHVAPAVTSGAGTSSRSAADSGPSGPSEEAQARSLARHAMDQAFAAGDTAEARRALEQALALCESDRCPATMVATLHRDKAVCDAALDASDDVVAAELREALRRDPSITLEAYRKTDRLVRLYRDAERAVLGVRTIDAKASVRAPGRESETETATAPGPGSGRAQMPSEIPPQADTTLEPQSPKKPEPPRLRHLWLGVEGSLDATFLSSAEDVCKLEGTAEASSAYTCTQRGADYPDRSNPSANDTIATGQLDSVAGGPALGNVRVKLRADWAFDEHWLVGLRAGYVANAYPGDAARHDGRVWLPVDLEGRVTYLLGKNPLTRVGASNYLYLGAGVGETDASVRVEVAERSGQVQSADAWQIGGFFYGSAGAGVRYAVAPNVGILAGPRFVLAIGEKSVMPVLAPEVGVHVGF